MEDGRIAVYLSDISTMDKQVDHRILELLSFNHSIGCPTRFTRLVTVNACSRTEVNTVLDKASGSSCVRPGR